jgi:hypothetical protein
MLNEILRESLGFVLSALIPSKIHIASSVIQMIGSGPIIGHGSKSFNKPE